MNSRQLEIFRAVATSGSATRAAELLEISQPAVSRAVLLLEESLGFTLFERTGNRLALTPEGRLFLREVEASFIGLDRLRSSAARIRDFGKGQLRIASLAALAGSLVPRAIRRFQQRNPEVAITLQIYPSATVRNLVADGEFDLGVAAEEADLSGIGHRLLVRAPAVIAIPPRHKLAARREVRAQDLHGLPFVALAPEDRARQELDAVLAQSGAVPKIVVETPNSTTVCALALEGVGVGLVNRVVTAEFEGRGLTVRPFTPEILFASYLLFHPSGERARLVRQFVHVLISLAPSARSAK